jgi:hypothetical protein
VSPIYTDRRCLAQSIADELMAASGSNSTAPPVPTDGLHHLTPSSLSSSLSDPVDLVLGHHVYHEMQKVYPTDLLH